MIPPQNKGVQQYRKKPVVIDAILLTFQSTPEVLKWIEDSGGDAGYYSTPPMRAITGIHIDTLEGDMIGKYGDYIIKGVQGEFYPCKPDIFEATYEASDPSEGTPDLTQATKVTPPESLQDSEIRRVLVNLAEHGDMAMLQIDTAFKALSTLIQSEVTKARKQDEYGNPIIFLNKYEAESVAKHLNMIREINNGNPHNTGDWFLDVPFKITKWLKELGELK